MPVDAGSADVKTNPNRHRRRDPEADRPLWALPCHMAIARFPGLVIDCPDPTALATFYGTMLDWKVDLSDGWADVRAENGHCISFQQVADYTPPRWPDQEVPQQMHLDVIVDDLDAGESAVLALGATKHEHQPGKTFRVFLDPAGHPFCLCIN
jgi:hypothetical protein